MSSLLGQTEVCARQRLCPPIPLCLLLHGLDAVPDFAGEVPTGSGACAQNPPTRGTNAKAEFCIREGLQEVDVYRLAFLLQSP